MGLTTSVWNCGWRKALLIFLRKSMRTLTCISGMRLSPSGCRAPASMRTNVVLPVPFSPSMTRISESVNSPPSILRWKSPSSVAIRLISSGLSATSPMRKESDSSRKRRFSVGTLPSRKMLMPSAPRALGMP
ncbi:hypothetical protein SYNPS1DRAFT_33272 [Syncephalis pseudoplumigaleata]|uniref:Uncharacterized protein n=1 Tax=Syncephalis pseudoplumigaleata TaxID=1712513 RepID=A0A4V1J180_9FUNG|nr:hypothetical protein SYNPS1DRAFT_33272 [Syncephalis pseudoplumigaleata]|eukprot:RKP24129.1 hypothetical protein SYNPS1DRAFT_33272 [Syncephalis pseudoplumigaleata]